MAVQLQRPLSLSNPFPDWQISLLVTALLALSILGLLGVVQSLPQESDGPRSESGQTPNTTQSQPKNFTGTEQKSGAATLGQR